ncbi:MAG: heavy metal-binding domain-containing protein [Cyanobacteria bacterium J06638_22]
MENIDILIFAGLLLLGLVAGTIAENKHIGDLKVREKKVKHLNVINFGAHEPLPDAQDATLVVGSVVIASDFFRYYVAAIISILGGNIGVYETLIDRGRREAILRMKEKAIALGARQVLNLRLETSNLSGESSQGGVQVEVIAYGTAIR